MDTEKVFNIGHPPSTATTSSGDNSKETPAKRNPLTSVLFIECTPGGCMPPE